MARSRFRPWMLGSVIWIAPAVFAVASSLGEARLNHEPRPPVSQLLWNGGDWLVYAAIAPFVFWASRRWPVTRARLAPRLALHTLFAALSSVAWSVLGKILQLGIAALYRPPQFVQLMQQPRAVIVDTVYHDVAGWIFGTLPFGAVVYICVAGMAHAIQYLFEARDREVQLTKLSEQLTSARLSALEAQINPHFLFNTLNTIAVRARDGDGAGTARMVEQLSELLRRTLSRHRTTEVSLGEELELVRMYLEIEQARFPDRLRASVDIDASAFSATVPSFAVQHLVENAVRHGIAKRAGAGLLEIVARRGGGRLEVAVSDDGPGINETSLPPRGHGIDNTRERLNALYGEDALLVITRRPEGGTLAVLRIPYHRVEAAADARR